VSSVQTLFLQRRDLVPYKEELGFEVIGLKRLSRAISVFGFFLTSVSKSKVVKYEVDLLRPINPVPGLRLWEFGSTIKQSNLVGQIPVECKFAVIEGDSKLFRVPLHLSEDLFLRVKRGLRNSKIKDSTIEGVVLEVISSHNLDGTSRNNLTKAKLFYQVLFDTLNKLDIKYVFFEGDYLLAAKLNLHNLVLITPEFSEGFKTKGSS
jgi:hypothetical protein